MPCHHAMILITSSKKPQDTNLAYVGYALILKKNPYFIAQCSKCNHVFLGLFAGFIPPVRLWASPSNRVCGLKFLCHINTTTSFQSSFRVRLLIFFPLLIWSLSALVGDLVSLVQDFALLVKQKLFNYLFSKHRLYIEDGRSFWV